MSGKCSGRASTASVLVVLLVVLSYLPVLDAAPTDAVEIPPASPNCDVSEPGVHHFGQPRWKIVDGVLTLECSFTDEALPPVFPATTIEVTIAFGSPNESEQRWQTERGGLFGDDGWLVELGEPVDFVAEPQLLIPSWECPNGRGTPSTCKIRQGAAARPHACAVAGASVAVSGTDGFPWLLDDRIPPIEWELTRRVLKELSSNNIEDIASDVGCGQLCTYTGLVYDHARRIPFVKVEIYRLGRVVATGDTGATGRYTITGPCDGLSDTDQSRRPRARVELADADGNFEVLYRGRPVVIESSPFATGDLARDFNANGLPDTYRSIGSPALAKALWIEWLDIYYNSLTALGLAEMLGAMPDQNLPLSIHADCRLVACSGQSTNTYAFYHQTDDPYIALGSQTARLSDPGRPDNREFHEFGHAVYHQALGNGQAASVGAHAGNLNSTTEASISEGFATWYAAMVNKHVLEASQPHVYNPAYGVGGGHDWDLEIDTRVFDGTATNDVWLSEERAIAGILLDLEDGAADYEGSIADPRVDVSQVIRSEVAGGVKFAGKVDNGTNQYLPKVHVNALLLRAGEAVHATTTIVWDEGINGGDFSRFSVVVPAGIEFDAVEWLVTVGAPAGGFGDDDKVDLSLNQLWNTIRRYNNGTGAKTAYDLYRAFRPVVGDADSDGDGVSDIDEIFVSHGVFSRSDGDNVYEPGIDTVGRTDRRRGETRHAVPDNRPAGMMLDVSDAPSDTRFIVSMGTNESNLFPRVRSALVFPNPNGLVSLPSLPAGSDSWTSVTAVYANNTEQVIDLVSASALDRRSSTKKASITAPLVPAGYRLLEGNGRVHTFGSASHRGDPAGLLGPTETAVAMATTSTTNGYMILTSAGRVGSYGDAPAFTSTEVPLRAGEKFTTIAITPDDAGYWVFTNQGRVVAGGTAKHHGDALSLSLAGEIIASVSTRTGNGYYLLGSDGGVFTFGDAVFYGSVPQVLPGVVLDCPVVGLVPTPSGGGYWMVACDGGVFAFGDAYFVGSLPGLGVAPVSPVNGMVAYGAGYLMVAGDGGAFNFGAPFFGSLGATDLSNPITAITPFLSAG